MHSNHSIDYIEFTVRDLATAKLFYADAFGWKLIDYGPSYAGIQCDNREVGGLCQSDEIRTRGPLVILFSSDLEVSINAVTAAGGRIVKEPYAFPGGRRFHFADPSGNELAVWSNV
jgi:predicted enzyme related to lactoylglutathione lyase